MLEDNEELFMSCTENNERDTVQEVNGLRFLHPGRVQTHYPR